MVLKDYRYRCFDDCTQVSPRPRPSAKSFFYTRYARQSLCAKCTVGNERSANLKIQICQKPVPETPSRINVRECSLTTKKLTIIGKRNPSAQK